MNDKKTIAEISTLADTLKYATENPHQTVERYLSAILFDKNLTRQQYWQVLLAMQTSYLTMEATVEQYTFTRNLMKSRSKLTWLESDLHYLDIEFCSTEIKSGPPFAQTEAEALGAMYVMEGATLGGSFIYNKLRRQDWLSDDHGLRFFYNYGCNRHTMWDNFQLALSQYDFENTSSRSLVIAGANKAFDLINSSVRDIVNHDKRL